jgi:hypothetical protein
VLLVESACRSGLAKQLPEQLARAGSIGFANKVIISRNESSDAVVRCCSSNPAGGPLGPDRCQTTTPTSSHQPRVGRDGPAVSIGHIQPPGLVPPLGNVNEKGLSVDVYAIFADDTRQVIARNLARSGGSSYFPIPDTADVHKVCKYDRDANILNCG